MTNPLTREAFAEWCEKQPADKEYDYWCRNCAIGQFMTASGFEVEAVGLGRVITSDGEEFRIPRLLDRASFEEPRSFGALASRLRAA